MFLGVICIGACFQLAAALRQRLEFQFISFVFTRIKYIIARVYGKSSDFDYIACDSAYYGPGIGDVMHKRRVLLC